MDSSACVWVATEVATTGCAIDINCCAISTPKGYFAIDAIDAISAADCKEACVNVCGATLLT